MTAAPKRSPAVRLLEWQAALVLKRPRWFVWPQVLLAMICVAYTVTHLQFSTRRNDLVDADRRYHRLFLEYRAEFGELDDLLAIVESENQEKNRQFVERLGARLRAETNLFQDVFFKGALPELGPKALLFLPTNTLAELQARLERDRPMLERFAGATNLNSLFLTVNRQFRAAQRETNGESSALVGALPALERIVAQARDSLVRPGTPPSPGIDAFFGGGPEAERQVYVTFSDGRLYLITARPVSRDAEGAAIRRLRELVRETRLEVPGVNADVTGGSVLEADEMAQSQADSLRATAVALVLVLIIFALGYRETGRPLKAMLCLLIGLAYSMAWTTAVVGRLNILTITFAPMLIGLAVDFGVHLVTRYEEELRRGESVHESLRRAMVNTGLGIFTGALTTAAAFFAMALTEFAGVREMGLITGGGLLVCLVPMMTMLPALLMKGVQNRLDRGDEGGMSARGRAERFILGRPWLVLGAGATATLLGLTQFPRVRFDYDLRNMQSAGLPAVEFEKKLLSATSTNVGTPTRSLLFGAVVATNAAQALSLEARLTNLATVADVQSIARLLVEDDREKLR
ncbi:MAG: MMPL family transporter, partial [Limisphaerales bacterium]